MNKREEIGDAIAICNLGGLYLNGFLGLPLDRNKGTELFLRAGELGNAAGYYNLGNTYHYGRGVGRDMEKAKYYYELGAMGGDVHARLNLGWLEYEAGNMSRAMKHWMIAAGAGLDEALKNIKKGYSNGYVTKDEFERALRAHQESNNEMKSDQRGAAAADQYFMSLTSVYE